MSQETHFDIIAVGSSFSTFFFLHRLLERSSRPPRVLILECGPRKSHDEELKEGDPHSLSARRQKDSESLFQNVTPEKEWVFSVGFGGSSRCWYACTPRMLPDDFRMKSQYGVGVDWPVSYDELEPYYCDAEKLMNISGSNEPGPWPMSRPYPDPPHAFSEAGKLFKKAFPNEFFPQATARFRNSCCANSVCYHCPVDAKFTILNGMSSVYELPNVEIRTNSPVRRFDHNESQVTSVTYFDKGSQQERTVYSERVVLGANAIFNPFIMLASGLDDPELGKGIVESVTTKVQVHFEDFQNFGGSTHIAGQGFMLANGPSRRERAASIMHLSNLVQVGIEPGRWLSHMLLMFTCEDLRQPQNNVKVSADDPFKPLVRYAGASEFCKKGIAHLHEDVPRLLNKLDAKIRNYEILPPWAKDGHIQGTHVMGTDPATSVVDTFGVHHRLRNLIVLGGGMFPTAPAANPTLTICALSLRAADSAA